jgi:PAS domain S-box-containing protein
MNTADLIGNDKHVSETLTNLETVESLRDFINTAHAERNHYYITNNRDYLENYRIAALSTDTVYNILREKNKDNTLLSKYLDTLSVLVKKRFAQLNTSIVIQEKNSRRYTDKISEIATEGKITNKEIVLLISRIKSEMINLMGLNMEMVNTRAKFTNAIQLGGTVLSIFLIILCFYLSKTHSEKKHDPNSPFLSREELDEIVKQRTKEIAAINQKLYNEIEEHKKDEEALKKAMIDYRILFEQAHDPIIIIEPKTENILDANIRACEVYGYKHDELLQTSMKKLSKNVFEGEKNIEETMKKGYFHNFQTVHYCRGGMEMLMEINASVIIYKGRQAILSINRDITDRILRAIPPDGK